MDEETALSIEGWNHEKYHSVPRDWKGELALD